LFREFPLAAPRPPTWIPRTASAIARTLCNGDMSTLSTWLTASGRVASTSASPFNLSTWSTWQWSGWRRPSSGLAVSSDGGPLDGRMHCRPRQPWADRDQCQGVRPSGLLVSIAWRLVTGRWPWLCRVSRASKGDLNAPLWRCLGGTGGCLGGAQRASPGTGGYPGSGALGSEVSAGYRWVGSLSEDPAGPALCGAVGSGGSSNRGGLRPVGEGRKSGCLVFLPDFLSWLGLQRGRAVSLGSGKA